MEIRLLGPVELELGDQLVTLGGPKQRAVLSLLALNANATVSVDRLIEGLWGEEQPASAAKNVQLYVSQLRKLLAGQRGVEIVTRGRGYELRLNPEAVDALRFERLIGDASDGHRNGPAGEAANRALSLWRGAPLADLLDAPFAAAEGRRLEELRRGAVELAVESDLEAGRHREQIARLDSLVAEHPLRERLHYLRMLALYRAGRQADALEAYRVARAALVDAVGTEPGPDLRRLHAEILRQDPALDLEVPELPTELTPDAPVLGGRDTELGQLRCAWRDAQAGLGRVVLVQGPAGIGKTRLAAELAGELHSGGASVVYVGGGAPRAAASLERARRTAGPALAVLDDLDRAPPAIVKGAGELAGRAGERSLLVLLAYRDDRPSAAVSRLARELEAQGAERLALRPLGMQGVREIAALYAGERSAAAPLERLIEASGGLPRRVHEVAAEWARGEAEERVGSRAGPAASHRGELRELEEELASNVVDLGAVRERAERYATRRPGKAGGRDGGGMPVCPFKGLASYDVADAAYFFGRERLVAEMVARLVGTTLLGVVGPSGSGKSSAVRAGLVPALAGGVLPGSATWPRVLLRPGEHPLAALRRALGSDAQDPIPDRLARLDPEDRLVLVVDQFEETFAACRDEAERAAFVAALVDAAHGSEGRALVVLAVRADYYGACAAHPRLARLVGASQVLVGPMRPEELVRAIEEPAQRAGLIVEPALVTRLVEDVAGQAGGLPLLSTALLELWQRRDGRRLRLATYEQTHGVQGAVARLAEDAYGRLGPHEKAVARRMLLRLAGTGEGDAMVRRQVPLDELETDRDERAARVLEVLTASRLVTVAEGTAEVAHEALLREWPRLRGWLEEDAEGRRLHRHLTLAARDWDGGGRDAAELYRGTRLAAALDWAVAHDAELNTTERGFLDASRSASERTQRRLRAGLAAVVALLVLAVVAGIVALEQRGTAREEAIAADAERLGARALTETDLDRALLLARQGLALDDSLQTRGNLLAALLKSPAAVGVIRPSDDPVLAIALSPDGRSLAVGTNSDEVFLYDARTRRRVASLKPTQDADNYSLAFSPDGSRLAIGYNAARVGAVLVDTRTRRTLKRLRLPDTTAITDLRFWPDGRTLAATLFEGEYDAFHVAVVTRFDARSGRRLEPIRVERTGRLSPPPWQTWPKTPVLMTSDARRLVVGDDDGITLRDAATLRQLQRFPVPAAAPRPVFTAYTLSPDDGTLAIGAEDGSLRLLDLRSGDVRAASERHDAEVTGAAFSANGRTLVTTGYDGDVIVWDVRRAVPVETLSGHAGGVEWPQLTPDDKTLYTASDDGTVFTWDLNGTRRLGRRFTVGAGSPEFPYLAVSSDGRLIARGQEDGAVSIVEAGSLERRKPLPVVPEGLVRGIAFVPGTHRMVVGGGDGFFALIDADRGRIVRRLEGHTGAVNTPGISADGRLLATSGVEEGVVRFWSLPDGRPLGPPLRFRAAVPNAQLSPDGRALAVAVGEIGSEALEIWDVRTRRRVERLRPTGGLGSVRFSRDGRLAAIGNASGQARVFTTADWNEATRPLDGRAGVVEAPAISPDGRTLATGGQDGTVRLWDIETGQPIGTPLPGLPNQQVLPHFTPDGAQLIASYGSGAAHLWDLRLDSLIRHACQIAGRRLSRAEWAEFVPGRSYEPAC
jgi:WD40 repeat protein/DNA-binding SARP family transcriptional activator